ncbi:hypothetical protein [Caballeronia mineralivorans]|uniref:hypothetical protein n=1 Tax=Caballeronia mineralivorans TaxID=2010198 RepID=UPI0023F286BE|nr:hypothetical protein [Caballeronia mineralivorans]MDB5787807.1 hypothetical protein [Caballeronia mineralivorans]
MNTANTAEGAGWVDQSDDANTIAMLVERVPDEGIETDLLMTNEGGRSHARNAPQFMGRCRHPRGEARQRRD